MTDICHSGVAHDENPPGRGSGRYAYGSGENPFQHQFSFTSEVKQLRKQGLKDAEIAKMLLGQKGTMKDGTPIWANTTDLRAEIAIQSKRERQANRVQALKLYDECKGNKSEAARRMGISESTFRNLLDDTIAERQSKYDNTAAMIKKAVDEKGYVDVGKGVELYLNVTESTKNVAINMLEKEGYVRAKVRLPQLGTKYETDFVVLAKPGTTYGEIQKNKTNIKQIQEYSPDGGKTWWTPEFPASLDSKRVMIRYGDEGGSLKDGVIEINPKAKDLSLDGANYAQVRIMVDNSHYMKGMAIYSAEKMPKGIDIIYNTNKKSGTPKEKVMKELKKVTLEDGTQVVDKDNPFGALIKNPKDRGDFITRGGQHYYMDENGEKKLSPINKLQEEGDWNGWSNKLSSQFLSKQSLKLIKQQIDLTLADKKNELEEIQSLTNQVIKKKMLEDFADGCDKISAKMPVKGFKNQSYQVILPVSDLKDNEIYAPKFKDGETVALVRYPHGGTFEIPVLKVNNKHANAKKIIRDATDAVGINYNVAEKLSGADFDGDTVTVIPLKSNRINITTSEPIKSLIDFDPKMYKMSDDAPEVTSLTKEREMGKITNLITDMTVQGADMDEIARAVRHSMVVIDSEKHHLDYKQSYKDNDILSLKKKYQGVYNEKTGRENYPAATIFSRSGSEVDINERREVTDTSRMTSEELKRWNEGYKVYRDTGNKIVRKITDTDKMTPYELSIHNSGKKVYRTTDEPRTQKVYRIETVDDAFDLVRDKSDPKESAYAEYSNALRKMAREARIEARQIKADPVSISAKKTYKEEVESLDRKLRIAKMNAPRERQAVVIANGIISEKLKSNPDVMQDPEHRKRENNRAKSEARAIVGAKKDPIVISDKEWEAIQAGAISSSKLSSIIDNSDLELFKKRATPHKSNSNLTDAQLALARSMYNSEMYTQSEIAIRLGVSPSTVSRLLKESSIA